VMHITTGGGGAPLYNPVDGRPNVVVYDKSYHFCKIDIDNNALKLTVKRSDGSIIEVFDYVKSGASGIVIAPSKSSSVENGKTMNVYPNPSNQRQWSVDLQGFEEGKDINCSIHHTNGQTVFEKKRVDSKHFELNLPEYFKKSIYLVSVESGLSRAVDKLIIN